MTDENDAQRLAREAKAIVALAFRNGPIEDCHAGQTCPVCSGKPSVSHITNAEMKLIMKSAVNCVYRLMRLKLSEPQMYAREIALGERYTTEWDDPE